MAFRGTCPYINEVGKEKRIVCECMKFSFPDKTAKREIIYGYCAHPTNWKECPFKKMMDNFYERKYNGDGNQQI